MTAWTLVQWLIHAVVAFFAGYYLGLWRGTCKGQADYITEALASTTALGKFLKGDVARKGGLEAVAKGIKVDAHLNATLDEMLGRMETLRLASMVAEYAFYVVLVGYAVFGSAYLAPIVGIPVCFMTVKQAVKERGQARGVETLLRLFGIFHAWLKEQPVDAFNYAKAHRLPVANLTNLLRESGTYAL